MSYWITFIAGFIFCITVGCMYYSKTGWFKPGRWDS